MAQYFALLRRRIEVQYRAGDIVLPATGTLVADFASAHFDSAAVLLSSDGVEFTGL